MFSSIDLCILRDACHKLFCVFGDFYAPGTRDAEVTKSLGEAYWSDFVNFHCIQLSLVRSMWFIFEIIKVTCLVHRIFDNYNFYQIKALSFHVFTHAYSQIVEYYIKSKHLEKLLYSTVNKVGSEKLLVRKSCFI